MAMSDEGEKREDEHTFLSTASLDEVVPSTPQIPIDSPQLTPASPQLAPASPLPSINSPLFAPDSPSSPSRDPIEATTVELPSENTADRASVATGSILSPNAEDKRPELLKPPTKAELKARAAKEKETLEAKRKEAETINAPVTDIPGTQSKPRPKPRPKRHSEAEIAALDAVINGTPNEGDGGPLLPANVKIFAMPDPQAEDVVPSRRKRNLTAEGRRQQEEIAEREARRKARSQKGRSQKR